MKIQPNEKVCLLLDKILASTTQPNNINNFKKDYFLATNPDITRDVPQGTNYNFSQICLPSNIYLSAAAKILGARLSTNAVVYPAMGMMGWHTNSDLEGTRVYYTKTSGEAIFSYMLDGVRVDDYDNVGEWTCRKFKITKDNPLWHAIWTQTYRYAFGFLL